MPRVLLRRLVDDDQWKAEDLAGRYGIVAHAAFLRTGFVPYGDEPSSGHLLKQVDEIGPSAPSLSRRYTAPQLAGREGGTNADAAVLEVRARGDGTVAFQAYLLTRDGNRRCGCEAVLDEAALAPLLACRVADAARALEVEEPADASASLWRSLVDCVFPVLFLELCSRNDLPVTDFASLPDEMKAEILKRLTDGKDLARVECAGSQLRRLVKERDGELWKAMCESLGLPPGGQSSSSDRLGSWKERYMNGRRRWQQLDGFLTSVLAEMEASLQSLLSSYNGDEHWLAPRRREEEADFQRVLDSYGDDEGWWARHRREREADLQRFRAFELPSPWVLTSTISPLEFTGFVSPAVFFHDDRMAEPVVPPRQREPEVVAKAKNTGRRQPRNRKAQWSIYKKKWHGAGAIHSPSSRYKWKHR